MYNSLEVIVISFAACVESIAAQQSPRPPVKPSFAMSISPVHETVKAGAEMMLVIEVTNTTDSEIRYQRIKNLFPLYTTEVFDSAGNAAPLTALGKAFRKRERLGPMAGSAWWVTIAPGESAKDWLTIQDQFDLKPGVYTVHLERIDPATKLVVKSNTATFTVTN